MSRGIHAARSLSATTIGVFAVCVAACSDESTTPFADVVDGGSGGQEQMGDAGQVSAVAGTTGDAGSPASTGGSSSDGGASAGGTTAQGGSSDGEGGSTTGAGGAGMGAGGEVAQGGSGGTTIAYCTYADDIAIGGAGGTDGAGGAGSASPNITMRTDAFLGAYLADGAGRTLYLYGRDLTGDCENPPISGCTSAACLGAWPPFYVAERVLADGLDASRFGSVEGPTGPITTYMGWPLYYYVTDTDPGMIKGQGKQGLWFAAEVELPAIIPMRAADGTVNHLATSRGYPLYVHALDTLGTLEASPVSACTGACAERHVPLLGNTISVASSVEPSDLSLFLRPDNQLQLAYKGAPLYLDAETPRPGQLVTPMPEQWGVALK